MSAGDTRFNMAIGQGEIDANENITKSDFKIFPNPSTGQFYLEFSEDIGDFTIDVFDLAGKLILVPIFAGVVLLFAIFVSLYLSLFSCCSCTL